MSSAKDKTVVREAFVAQKLSRGYTPTEIRDFLGVSKGTVSNIKKRLRRYPPEFVDWMMECPVLDEVQKSEGGDAG